MQHKQLLSQALHKAASLKLLLDTEFEALKFQDLTTFEALQAEKIDVLRFLARDDLTAHLKSPIDIPPTAAARIAEWDQVITIVAECKGLHRRNQILIDRKLESIRGALRTLQSPDHFNDVEIYDRLGKIKGKRRPKKLSHA